MMDLVTELKKLKVNQYVVEEYIKLLADIPVDHKQESTNFIVFNVKNEKSSNTVKEYIRDLQQFFRFLEIKDIKLRHIENEDIEEFKNYLFNIRKLKDITVNRKITSVNQYLKLCNITVNVKTIKIQEQKFLTEMLTTQEVKRMMNASSGTSPSSHRNKAIIATLYLTGLRVSELLQLKLEDVNKSTIRVIGKGAKHRNILIPNILKDFWRAYLRVRGESNSNQLFIGTRGPLKRQAINKMLKRCAGKAKTKKSKAYPHNFRHLYCKDLAEQGVPIQDIADLAGHSNINTTRIYTRKTENELRSNIENKGKNLV